MATEGSAGWYRERAGKLRELAAQLRDPDARREQLKIAEQFERLARHAEAQDKKHRAGGA